MDEEKFKAFQSDEGLWGVGTTDTVLYEADMCRLTAETIADMYNTKKPPKDWNETARRLDAAGLPY